MYRSLGSMVMKPAAVALSVLLILGCALKNTIVNPPDGNITVLKSLVPRDTSPSVAPAQLAAYQSGQASFALNLYKKVIQDGNACISPYSISSALAMTYAGARNVTAGEMASVLGYGTLGDSVHPINNYISLQLASRGKGASGREGAGFSLNINNALWGEKTVMFVPRFLDVLAVNYGAGMNIVDFINNPENTRLTINGWVSEKTQNKINDLLPSGSVTSFTRLILTNTVYFDAVWKYPFTHESTFPDNFHRSESDSVSVLFMHQEGMFKYAANSECSALRLPYDGDSIAMTIIVPAQGTLTQYLQALTGPKLAALEDSLARVLAYIHIPKFSFESGSVDLTPGLVSLGMVQAFSATADFSGVDNARDLSISGVLHKTMIAVDEVGTTAAAATGVLLGGASLGAAPSPAEFSADRPFIFVIQDIPTGTILFMGQVVNPAE